MGRQGPCLDVLTQENCRKVTRSVEDAEIKTNVLKQNSALLEVRGRETPGSGRRTRGTRSLSRLQVELSRPAPPRPIPSCARSASPCTVIFRSRTEGFVPAFEWECL